MVNAHGFDIYSTNKQKEDFLLSSTEIYVGSAWIYAASLPSRRSHMPAFTLENSVFVFGKFRTVFSTLIGREVHGSATPAILCHKEPARVSLWHKG